MNKTNGRQNKILGNSGESASVAFLEKKGYTILVRNYRAGKGEIDIIARHGDVVVFFEIKTRKSDLYGRPAEGITTKQRAKLLETASAYAQKFVAPEYALRFDVIEVFATINGFTFNHIENAFA